jgi:hypothetical protein
MLMSIDNRSFRQEVKCACYPGIPAIKTLKQRRKKPICRVITLP